jgi:hypothetical protein
MIWLALFQRNLLFVSSGGFLKMEVVGFFQSSILSRLFCACLEGNNSYAFGMKCGLEMEEGQGLVLNNNFGRMISHINIYRNLISLSVYHNFSSAYTAISDTTGGHFWANKLLRTCRVITVTVPTFHGS